MDPSNETRNQSPAQYPPVDMDTSEDPVVDGATTDTGILANPGNHQTASDFDESTPENMQGVEHTPNQPVIEDREQLNRAAQPSNSVDTIERAPAGPYQLRRTIKLPEKLRN